MATATMATAAGAAALLYYTLNRKLQVAQTQSEDESAENGDGSKPLISKNRVARKPAQAPATWLETISTLSETLRFTYSETLGKWPIGDLAFGINFLLKRQGNLDVASVYAGKDSVQLKGAHITAELKYLLNLLTLCWHFSKKPFPLFLETTGYTKEDVLLQEPKAGILKPAFTILIDRNTKCILLLIRGTHSIRDTLTAATGAVVPFHHTVVNEGGVSDLILGYAHCGMVAAARWIAKLATPCLMKALHEYPDYELKIVGHSLGGGTAAILTYVLREHQEFATTTCVTFAPGACMTWELAESGVPFITSVINGADLVPTFSAAAVDDLRSEEVGLLLITQDDNSFNYLLTFGSAQPFMKVTASAWLNDLKNQVERTRILSTVYRSATALGSRLPSISSARARVAGAGAILRPVSNGTQVVMNRARNVAQAAWTHESFRISSWSCMGPRHRQSATISSSKSEENGASSEPLRPSTSESGTESEERTEVITSEGGKGWTSEHSQDINNDDDVGSSDGEDLMGHGRIEDRMTEVELWQRLEHELNQPRSEEVAVDEEEEEDMMKEAREEEEEEIAAVSEVAENVSIEPTTEMRRFFPPGKIMHIVSIPREETANEEEESNDGGRSPSSKIPGIGIFLTPRSLYGKLRLSRTMINDHYMPMYKRNIESVISELEKDGLSMEDRHL